MRKRWYAIERRVRYLENNGRDVGTRQTLVCVNAGIGEQRKGRWHTSNAGMRKRWYARERRGRYLEMISRERSVRGQRESPREEYIRVRIYREVRERTINQSEREVKVRERTIK